MVQLQFLNYVLSSRDKSLISLNNLTEDYFSDYREEFKFIKNHIETYDRVPDVETFLNRFKDFDIVDVKESESYLISALMDDYNTRKLANTFKKISPLIQAGRVDEAIELYKRTAENLNKGISLKSVDIIKDTSRYDAYIEKCKDSGKYYVSTGFPELDAIIGGFDRQEELATIVARTNYGKSWILLKCAVASANQGLKVGIYSGEMSENKVGYRIDTLIGHINNGGIIHGNSMFSDAYKEYIEKLPTLISGSIKVITPAMIEGPATVSALKMFIEKEELDILFVDQLSLLEDQRKGKTPVEKASNISKDLKILQVMKKIPIISVSQQNRTSSENGVDTTQIAMSDRIGQDSTLIIFLEKKDTLMKLTIVKSRDSENGKVLSYNVDLNKGNFVFIPTEGEAVSEAVVKSYEKKNSEDGDYF